MEGDARTRIWVLWEARASILEDGELEEGERVLMLYDTALHVSSFHTVE
jgi:hypothetical protein